jgi:hypothetical protein
MIWKMAKTMTALTAALSENLAVAITSATGHRKIRIELIRLPRGPVRHLTNLHETGMASPRTLG